MQSDSDNEIKPQKKNSKAAKPDLAKVFDLKKQEEVKYEECHKKLNSDDVSMMKQLIAKYGNDFKRMFVDIKLNFMQYSKGQLKAKYNSYYHYGHDKKGAEGRGK